MQVIHKFVEESSPADEKGKKKGELIGSPYHQGASIYILAQEKHGG
jgi:hypothetical protein